MKIATWNVNSIRARIENFLQWVNEENPDIILLQEIRCTNEQFPYSAFDDLNYNIEVLGEKSRNGVAIFSKFKIYDVVNKLPLYNMVDKDDSSRYLEASIDYGGKVIKIASIYVPNGGPSAIDIKNDIKDYTTTDNFNFKMKFDDRLNKRFQQSIKDGEIGIFAGDFNVCPNLYMDVYSVDKDGSITCTEQERQKFEIFIESGMTDVWRDRNKELRDYTWWGYRPYYMWEKNYGYRLDAIMATPNANKIIEDCKICREVRAQDKASDHVPMVCEIKV